ncbi:MAG: ATP-binding cassette domain-containing protein, partial [Acidaminococcaceae bacterium]|nr:ATP-binding cassette domain-containing protein [Acidaminococcaceae bacterium]
EDYIRRFKAGIKSKMARGRQSQLDRLERVAAPVRKEEFTLRLPKATESAEKVIILEELNVGYGEKTLLKNINLVLTRGEKIAILGTNGAGKTTLLKTILQEIAPLSGTAKIGNRVQIGYFSQSYERLNSNETIMDNFLNEYGYTDEQTRKLLGSMLFRGEEVFKEISTLSGGQKARLVLLKLVLDGANCLLLDEPTNHLDIFAKEAVEAALETFDGTVLLVSHDRYLVNEVAERIWEIEDGTIKDYKGNYDFYLEQREKQKTLLVQPIVQKVTKTEHMENKKQVAASSSTKAKHYSPSEAEKLLPKVELNIREQEAMLKVLEAKIADPASQTSFEVSAELAKEYAEYKATIAKLMVKWEQIMESLE